MRTLLVATALAACIVAEVSWGGGLPAGVGDTIDVSVYGFPALHKKSMVEEDGTFPYFMLGELKVAGLSSDEFRQQLTAQLVKEGLVKDPKISVEIVARQPIYITGDVLKPGVQQYLPNTTVRSAVALAGDLDPLGLRGASRGTLIDAKVEYKNLILDRVRQRAHLRALAAERAKSSDIEFEKVPEPVASAEVVSKINRYEVEQLRQRLTASNDEKVYLQRLIDQAKAQIASLNSRRQAAEEALQRQTEDVARIKGYIDRGLVIQERYLDAQRSMLLLRTSVFDSVSASAQAAQLLIDSEHKLQSLEKTRAIAITREMLDATVADAVISARIEALQGRNLGTNAGSRPSYMIYRQRNGPRQRMEADADAHLLPGDVLEVSLAAARPTDDRHVSVSSR